MQIRRGDIYYADLSPVVGSEQGGVRPVLVIQNDVGNRHSPTVICAAITSRMNKAKLPTHVEIDAKRYRIVKDSVVLLEQIRTIDKQRLRHRQRLIQQHWKLQLQKLITLKKQTTQQKAGVYTRQHCRAHVLHWKQRKIRMQLIRHLLL